MSTEKIVVDTREVAHKLSFLVGKTILFREVVDDSSDSTTATNVLAVRAENTSGASGRPEVRIYTNIGVQRIGNSREFNDIMLLNGHGELTPLGNLTDNLGVVF